MGSTSQENKGFSKKILVVEDDAGLNNLILRTLNSKGFIAQGIGDGVGALHLMNEDSDRVLLIDHQLPDMTGRDLVEILLSRGLKLQFIMMTGQGDEKLAVEVMKMGASDYLVKEIGFYRMLPGIFERVFRNIETEMLLQKAEESRALLEKEMEITKNTLLFKQKFLASISHEIRTPLTGVVGIIDLLEKTNLDHQQRDYIATLKHSSDNLREIIDQVLDYSRIEAGKVSLHIEPCCFVEIAAKATSMFNGICRKPVTFSYYVDPDLPACVMADHKRIIQIINNLLVNAVKFTNQGKIILKIKLVNEDKDGNVLIEISMEDTGVGIPEKDLSSIFIPFSQAQNIESSEYVGSGLGLSICRELVEMHGGTIKVESTKGKGSTFTFTIMAQRGVSADLKLSRTVNQKLQNGRKLNILLAEDKLVNQKVIKMLLNSLGHEVIIVSNGRDAISDYIPDKFDLILMDIQMPVMDGITATRKMKKKFSNLPPIVGLSANAFEGDRERYMQQGMDEYLTKPVKAEDFVQLIEKMFA